MLNTQLTLNNQLSVHSGSSISKTPTITMAQLDKLLEQFERETGMSPDVTKAYVWVGGEEEMVPVFMKTRHLDWSSFDHNYPRSWCPDELYAEFQWVTGEQWSHLEKVVTKLKKLKVI